jgi:AcrR family transcriptional regulator
VLEAAEDAIESGRFADLSVEGLAKRAGISRSKFYVYFQDRDDLIREWFSEVRASLEEAQEPWWELDETATKDDLRGVLADTVAAYQPFSTLMAAVYDEALYNPVIREEVDIVIEESTSRLAKHIRRGQREGFIQAALLPTETAAWLTWMAERTQHGMEPRPGRRLLDRHIDTYTEIVWSSLYAGA